MARNRRGRGGGNGGNGRGNGGGRGRGGGNSSSSNSTNRTSNSNKSKKASSKQLGTIEALKGCTFGYNKKSAHDFEERCAIIINYLGSELKIGPDCIQELQTRKRVVIDPPTTDPNHPQLLAHKKKEAIRKKSANQELVLLWQKIAHYTGELAKANMATGRDKDMEEIFRLQQLLNELDARKATTELEISTDQEFVMKGEDGLIQKLKLEDWQKRIAKLKQDRTTSFQTFFGATEKDFTDQAELKASWETVKDDITNPVQLLDFFEELLVGQKEHLTLQIQVKERLYNLITYKQDRQSDPVYLDRCPDQDQLT